MSQNAGTNAQAALKKQFGSAAGWVAGTTSRLHSNGFNGLGAWSDTARFGLPPNRWFILTRRIAKNQAPAPGEKRPAIVNPAQARMKSESGTCQAKIAVRWESMNV